MILRRGGICCLTALSALGAWSCETKERGESRVLPALAAGQSFIALERDFQGFREWHEIPVPKEATAQGITHTAGRRREFINVPPPAGSQVFQAGTVLVKEIETGAPEGHKIFGMVKRSGGFNSRGAVGWEWFELHERKDHTIAIAWRGLNAPSGESYGGDPIGGCNACHGLAKDNDYVRAEAAALSKWAGR